MYIWETNEKYISSTGFESTSPNPNKYVYRKLLNKLLILRDIIHIIIVMVYFSRTTCVWTRFVSCYCSYCLWGDYAKCINIDNVDSFKKMKLQLNIHHPYNNGPPHKRHKPIHIDLHNQQIHIHLCNCSSNNLKRSRTCSLFAIDSVCISEKRSHFWKFQS